MVVLAFGADEAAHSCLIVNSLIGGIVIDAIDTTYFDNCDTVACVTKVTGSDAGGADPSIINTVESHKLTGGGTREANVVFGPWTYAVFLEGMLCDAVGFATDTSPLFGSLLWALTVVTIGINGKIMILCTSVYTVKTVGHMLGSMIIDGAHTDG